MRAARLHGPRTLRVEALPSPRAGAGEVVVRVTDVGLCGSDLHYFCDGHIGESVPASPLVLGHEFAGVIEALGPGVAGLSVGQTVAVDPAIPCGTCEVCIEGNPNVCPMVRFAGTPPIDGALRDVLTWPARQIVPLPAGMSATAGAVLETLGVCLHALNLAHVRLADRVAVLGGGPIGLLIARLARLSGAADVIVTDLNPNRLAAATAHGATHVVDAGQDDPVAAIHQLSGGRGVDVAFDAAGALETPQQGVDVLRPGGRLVIVGICAEDRIPLGATTARRKGVTIMLSRRMKHVYPRAIALVQRGMVDVDALVTHHYTLDQTTRAFEHIADPRTDALKVIVHPS